MANWYFSHLVAAETGCKQNIDNTEAFGAHLHNLFLATCQMSNIL